MNRTLAGNEQHRSPAAWIVPAAAFAAAYLLYAFSGAKGIFWGDAGEFAAAARTLGIGHPYGHPLFWLLGRLSMMLSPAHATAAMTELTAVTAAGTAAAAAIFSRNMLSETVRDTARIVIPVTAALTLAVMETVWIQATFIEVYQLQALLAMLALVTFQRYLDRENIRSLFAAVFFLGLAVTLGMYAGILIVLPLLVLIRRKGQLPGLSLPAVGALFLCFCIGLSLWIYLPARTAANPPFAWVHIDSLRAFLAYLSRSMYEHIEPAGAAAVKTSFQQTALILLRNIGIWGGLLILVWLWGAIKDKTKRDIWPYPAAALVIIVISGILIPLTLSFRQMVDMDVYFLPAFLLLVPVLTRGLEMVAGRLNTKAVWLLIVPVAATAAWQWSGINCADKDLTERFQTYLVTNLPAGSTLILSSDEVAHPLFDAVYANENRKGFRVPLTGDVHVETVLDTSLGVRPPCYFELNNYFVRQFMPTYRFALAGPLVVHEADSSAALVLEKRFNRLFSPDSLHLQDLHRLDRLSMARIWSRRGVYWFQVSLQASPGSNEQQTSLQQAVRSFRYAARFDDFSLEGALHEANLALVLARTNAGDEAGAAARRALRLNSRAPEAFRALYFISVQKQDYSSAIEFLKKAMHLSRATGDDYIKLATLYLLTGQKEDGAAAYQQALDLGASPQPGLENAIRR